MIHEQKQGEPPTASVGLQPHQQRVIEEKAALDDKLMKLMAFFDSSTYANLPTEDRILLIAQHTHMKAYSDTLGTRIARFKL